MGWLGLAMAWLGGALADRDWLCVSGIVSWNLLHPRRLVGVNLGVNHPVIPSLYQNTKQLTT